MKREIFETKVKKRLWFLNKKEKIKLNQFLKEARQNQANSKILSQPVKFSNLFLKQHVFSDKTHGISFLFVMIVGMLLANALLLGLFLFGLLTSLNVVNYFIDPQTHLSTIQLIFIMIGAIAAIIISCYLIRIITAFFTKKLLEYRFNHVQ
ncbi:hypothetical protein CD149_09435 [Staphylococcus condimenti]|uniref:Uncharacterized protein n=2 Tax=Staphylococcus condimenti TaxID=70255 RepID=A0A143P8R7_9STAP|nr:MULTISPECIES: hypothetical protein [Staphylococcus]AMY04498.1 hypothetical protein A4G25_00625 [Staphylococcus condimenti]APR60736.1 hypothetical protein BTZ13_05865 [Staphylococcus condimenti]MDK8644822.1 hypothetical protein [Staphylococcus condimenti]OFO98878.1 hypothetical protein HMPREF3007_00250 [Staphylococcus sp. HMSC065E08]PNZ58931.1 hypothetical protein CD149_09435 [Staphylococcus condimenti]